VQSADVAIVGAGVIGCAIAYELARSTTLHIVVLDRGTPGCEASSAAAGVLAVASGRARQGVLLDLRRRSAAMFPDLTGVLQEETRIDVGYRPCGLIAPAYSTDEAGALQDLVAHRTRQGFRSEMLEPVTLRSMEPALSPAVSAGAWFGDEASVHSERLVAALVAAARRRKVEFRTQCAVHGISSTRAGVRLQVGQEVLEAATAVVAAGAWSAPLLEHSYSLKVPLRPARGEMVAVKPVAWRLQHILAAGETYLVPRADGEVVIGSTTAFVGFDKQVTAEGLARLQAGAAELVPQIRAEAVVRTWAGLRPCSTIRRPIIAPLPGVDHVILATGHHRNGILLAPITARMVTEMITGAAPSVPLRPFSYRRH
jgi:glycine oxidase